MKKRFLRHESGQSLVEFALVLPILLALLCGIIDFGWLYYNQISLNNTAREGARYAAIHYDASGTWEAKTDKYMTDNFGITPDRKVKSGDKITVSVTDSPRILTGFTSTILGKNEITIHAECTMRIEN